MSAATDDISDAIVLFDGKDMSKWVELGKRENAGKVLPVSWKVENGYVQCVPRMGDIATKDKFGDVQLHIEWSSPAKLDGDSQNRGNYTQDTKKAVKTASYGYAYGYAG